MIKYLVFILLDLSLSLAAPVDTQLELVQVLFRHGDRSPVMAYPNDPYNETTWSKYGGFGQLTQIGMQQHNQWGRYLRDRYLGFLDVYYNKNKVVVRSTDFDRTLMSAYSLLSGLFPPVDFQEWNRKIQWQPIAVHTTSAKDDMVFFSNTCPRLTQLKQQVLNSTEYKQMNEKYQKLFDIINKNGGYKNMNLNDLWEFEDPVFCEKTHGLRLPNWVEAIYEDLRDGIKWGWYFDYRLTEIAKLTSGAILNDMIKNILNKIRNKTLNQLHLYSGHDTYVAGMIKLLELTEMDQPPYASSLVFELRSQIGNNDNYFVQVYYKNNTGDEPIKLQLLTINGCEALCPLSKFLDLTANLVVNDFTAACKAQS